MLIFQICFPHVFEIHFWMFTAIFNLILVPAWVHSVPKDPTKPSHTLIVIDIRYLMI